MEPFSVFDTGLVADRNDLLVPYWKPRIALLEPWDSAAVISLGSWIDEASMRGIETVHQSEWLGHAPDTGRTLAWRHRRAGARGSSRSTICR